MRRMMSEDSGPRRGTAAWNRSGYLTRSLVPVAVPESRVLDRFEINRARQWLEDDLRLPLTVDYFILQECTFDQRNRFTALSAEMGEALCDADGYVLRTAPTAINLRLEPDAAPKLRDLLEVLVHEACHAAQLAGSRTWVMADRRESDADDYVRRTMPRLREALRR